MPTRTLTGSRIRDRRSALRMKQADVASLVGISPSYLNLIEHNRRRIGGKLLSDIARVLSVDVSILSEGAEAALLESLREAAQTKANTLAEMSKVEEFAGRFPGWAATLAASQKRITQLERTVETLTDRLAHDPQLSASMHEVLSTVSAIRSTASILAEPGEIDPNWLGRFHKNIHEDAKRLSESATEVVNYLDDAPMAERSLLSPPEELDAKLASTGHHISELESDISANDAMVWAEGMTGFSTRAGTKLFKAHVATYLADAGALPLENFHRAATEDNFDPIRLSERLGEPLDRIFRRLASLPSAKPHKSIGYVSCDASGAILLRKPVGGFQVPHFGAGCPLWPLYQALAQPSLPVRAVVLQAGRDLRTLIAYAIALPFRPDGFSGPTIQRVSMVLVPKNLAGEFDEPVREVGQSCRICPRQKCTARREPSIFAEAI